MIVLLSSLKNIQTFQDVLSYIFINFSNDRPIYGLHWWNILFGEQEWNSCFKLEDNLNPAEKRTVSFSEKDTSVIPLDEHKCHGMYMNSSCAKGKFIMVALETSDKQIDFNTLHLKSKPG